MMNLSVLNYKGEDTQRKVALRTDIFDIDPNDHAIYMDIKNIMANKRQGTHKTKQRHEISGSSKKIKKQKGTGSARAGNIKNPQFVGGGRVFGPTPRDYSFKLNKKVKKLARISALSYKAKDQAITVVEDFQFDTPKTKHYINFLQALSEKDKKTLLVLPEPNHNIMLSGRNIKNTKITTAMQINTYDIIHSDRLIMIESVLQKDKSLFNPSTS